MATKSIRFRQYKQLAPEKLKAGQYRIIVAVYDDRVPMVALRNVRVIAGDKDTVDDIAEKALKEVYETKAFCNEHCTHVLLYTADQMWHVIDGDVFVPIVYRNGIDIDQYKSKREVKYATEYSTPVADGNL